MTIFKYLHHFFISIVILYLSSFTLLFIFQRSLIYYPQPKAINNPDNTLTIPVEGETIEISFQKRDTPNALIYFGGNGEDVSGNLYFLANTFPQYSVYLLHYRSYGHSTGTPSEIDILKDAQLLFDKVHAEHSNIIVMGCSLGTGIATQLASLKPANKLILITPFDSLQNVAKYRFPFMPIDWILKDKYESWRYAPKLTLPTLILMAEHDQVIPRANTERLYAQFKSGVALFKVIANRDHGSIYQDAQYVPLLKAFVAGQPING